MENEVIKRLKELFYEQYEKLCEIAKHSREEYLKDKDLQAICERKLQVSIQICIDMANRLISLNKWEKPESYAEAFEVLYRHNVIDENMFNAMAKFAGLRNLLVHGYAKIMQEALYDTIKNDLKYLKNFVDNF